MKRVVLALAVLFVLVAGLGAWGWQQWNKIHAPAFPGDEARHADIVPGSSARAIFAQLADAGILPDSRLPELYYRFTLEEPPLQAGEYEFAPGISIAEVVAKVVAGEVITRPLTIIEGLTVQETAEEVERQGFATAEAFLTAASTSLIADLDPAATTLEGYLFPDTYFFPRSAKATDIVAAMVGTFRERTHSLRETLGVGESGVRESGVGELRELVILASIVEKETQVDSERALVAGVYRNRLNIGMALYADPTIIYALKLAGTWDGDLRRRDLKMDSPYNTYLVGGLPPSPIASPGLASLNAAANPSQETYLYFVSKNDGTHVFAKTLAEHNRNVNKWQRQYWRERRRAAAQ